MNKKNLRKVTKVLLSLIIILCVIFMINLETVKATSEGEGKVTILPEKSSQFEEWESLSDSEREETIIS